MNLCLKVGLSVNWFEDDIFSTLERIVSNLNKQPCFTKNFRNLVQLDFYEEPARPIELIGFIDPLIQGESCKN